MLCVCLLVRELAQYDSFLKIRISDSVRIALMIFSFKNEAISVFCIISQILAYVMVGLFILSRFVSLDFLLLISDDPNALYQSMLKAHLLILFPVALIEEGICYLVKRISNRR